MSSLITVLALLGCTWWFGYRCGQETERQNQVLREFDSAAVITDRSELTPYLPENRGDR